MADGQDDWTMMRAPRPGRASLAAIHGSAGASPARRSILTILALLLALASSVSAQSRDVEQWGTFETSFTVKSDGKPYPELGLSATFTNGEKTAQVAGFYDGDGVYRVRFMPDAQGVWRYSTKSDRGELDGKSGEFTCVAPSSSNHGPVRVHNKYHFAYVDGTPFAPFGTTCYGWAHEGDEMHAQTLATLKSSPFNKVRMCVLTTRRPGADGSSPLQPFTLNTATTRPTEFVEVNPEFFQRIDKAVADLRNLDIQADVILFHPYASHFWDHMTPEMDARYLRYAVARLGAYRNVWWSMANEFDFCREKKMADWDRLFDILQASDPYAHLASVHNGSVTYDFHKPWVTHMSVQNHIAAEDFGRAVIYRQIFPKPLVLDEVGYEGNIGKRWGQLSPEEMVKRFWFATIAGTYTTHGETYARKDGRAWTGNGGILEGKSAPRIAFLKEILAGAPGGEVEPIDQYHALKTCGKPGEFYLIYFGDEKPTEWTFELPRFEMADGIQFRAEVIDTWNMTITPVADLFTMQRYSQYNFRAQGEKRISLPGREYMALRIRRVHEDAPPATRPDRQRLEEQ